jgi:hypothetical protein
VVPEETEVPVVLGIQLSLEAQVVQQVHLELVLLVE